MALNGRFGPYLKKGTDTRSLTGEEELFTVTLDEALALFAQPKRGRGRTAAAPLKELGDDPDTKQPIVLRAGRFGPYVTDGTTNASLRQGDDARDDHPRARRRAPGRPPRRRPPGQAGQEGGQGQEDGGQEDGGQEDRRQEDGGQEDRRQEDGGDEGVEDVEDVGRGGAGGARFRRLRPLWCAAG